MSCKTNKVFIPGEKQEAIQNIYSEYYNIAEEYFKLNNYSKAIEFYQKSMGSEKLHDAAYYKTGRCYALSKDYDKAEVVFNNILKKDPDNVSIKSSLAYLTAMRGDAKKAAELYGQLVQVNPDNADLLINYISVLIVLKDYESAKLNFDYLQKKYPSATQLESLKDNLEKLSDSNK